jgi:hypothetical protein
VNVKLTYRTSNERVIELKQSVAERMKVNKLRWFSHMERMSEERLTKIKYKAEKAGERRRGRPQIGWMEGIEKFLKEGVRSTRCKSERRRQGQNEMTWRDGIDR